MLTTASAGSGSGTISPGTATVAPGQTTSFTLSPATGSNVTGASGCDGRLSGTTYTTGAASGNCTVAVTFSLNQYTLSATAGIGGTVSPGTATVDHGSTSAFTVTPASGFAIGAVSGCQGSLAGNTYTTAPATGDCQVVVDFYAATYTVLGEAGDGGTIQPAVQYLQRESTATFEVVPRFSHRTVSVVGCNGTLSGTVYTTGPITGPCNVIATFATRGARNVVKSSLTVLFNPISGSEKSSVLVQLRGLDPLATGVARFFAGASNVETPVLRSNGTFSVNLTSLQEGGVDLGLELTDQVGNAAFALGQARTAPSVSATSGAFAAIRDDGSVVTWGETSSGGSMSPSVATELNAIGKPPVVQVYSNPRAFAALRRDGSVVTWGAPAYGGDSSSVAAQLDANDGRPKVVEIFSTQSDDLPLNGAFAALRADGSVVPWGAASVSGETATRLSAQGGEPQIVQVQSTWGAFAAHRADGSVVAWGNQYRGGFVPPALQEPDGPPVVAISSTMRAFAALRADGSVVAWGGEPCCDSLASSGGDSAAVARELDARNAPPIVKVVGNGWAFAALREDGTVVTWGYVLSGGRWDPDVLNPQGASPVVDIVATSSAFAFVRADGSVTTWGSEQRGGDSSLVTDLLRSGVVRVFGNSYAFAALKTNGSVVTWGDPNLGGDSSAVAVQLSAQGVPRVVRVASTSEAFAALREDGSVIAWGSGSRGGDASSVVGSIGAGNAPPVVEIFSNQSVFAALRADGRLFAWGSSNAGARDTPVEGVTLPVDGTIRLGP